MWLTEHPLRAIGMEILKVVPRSGLNVQVLAKGSDALFGLLARPGEPARSLDDMNAAICRLPAVHEGAVGGV